MRRAIKEKVNGILDNSRASFNAGESVSHDQQRRPMTDRVVGFVRERGAALASTVQEHVTSVTDTTGTLAKQKLLQTLFSSGVVQSEHVRRALQIGESISFAFGCQDSPSSYIRDRLLSRSTTMRLRCVIDLYSTSEIPSTRWYHPTTFSAGFRYRSSWTGCVRWL